MKPLVLGEMLAKTLSSDVPNAWTGKCEHCKIPDHLVVGWKYMFGQFWLLPLEDAAQQWCMGLLDNHE